MHWCLVSIFGIELKLNTECKRHFKTQLGRRNSPIYILTDLMEMFYVTHPLPWRLLGKFKLAMAGVKQQFELPGNMFWPSVNYCAFVWAPSHQQRAAQRLESHSKQHRKESHQNKNMTKQPPPFVKGKIIAVAVFINFSAVLHSGT